MISILFHFVSLSVNYSIDIGCVGKDSECSFGFRQFYYALWLLEELLYEMRPQQNSHRGTYRFWPYMYIVIFEIYTYIIMIIAVEYNNIFFVSLFMFDSGLWTGLLPQDQDQAHPSPQLLLPPAWHGSGHARNSGQEEPSGEKHIE